MNYLIIVKIMQATQSRIGETSFQNVTVKNIIRTPSINNDSKKLTFYDRYNHICIHFVDRLGLINFKQAKISQGYYYTSWNNIKREGV